MSTTPNLVERILKLPPELRVLIYEEFYGARKYEALVVPSNDECMSQPSPLVDWAVAQWMVPFVLQVTAALRHDIVKLKSPYETIRIATHEACLDDFLISWITATDAALISSIEEFHHR